LIRIGSDLRFSRASAPAGTPLTAAEVLDGTHDVIDHDVTVTAEPILAASIRATSAKGNSGYRVVPARGTEDRLWLVLPGNGWHAGYGGAFTGRVRKLDELPFAAAMKEYRRAHPRPVFATVAAARAGFANNKVATVDGASALVADADHVVFELVDPDAATLTATFNERFPDATAWTKALAGAGIPIRGNGTPSASGDSIRYDIGLGVPAATPKLEAATLWAARVDPVTRHYDTTWGALKTSPAGALVVGGASIPDAQVDLLGLYAVHDIPADSYAVLVGEQPESYWYAMPIAVALALIGLVFAWALVRAVRRDLLPPRA
jgi:hypothetical protein